MGLSATEAIKRLGISRTAYYKHLKSLQVKGYIGFAGDYPQNPQFENYPDSLMLTCDWLGIRIIKNGYMGKNRLSMTHLKRYLSFIGIAQINCYIIIKLSAHKGGIINLLPCFK